MTKKCRNSNEGSADISSCCRGILLRLNFESAQMTIASHTESVRLPLRLRRLSLIRILAFVLRHCLNFCIASRQFSRQFDYELPH
jgi:hypothetical protein